jgi:hypothetical protein
VILDERETDEPQQAQPTGIPGYYTDIYVIDIGIIVFESSANSLQYQPASSFHTT